MRRRWLAACLAAALLAAAGPAGARSDPAARRAAFDAAVQAYDRGDYETAFETWLPLARDDDPAAQRNLGHLYRRGLGVGQDFERAAYWYRRAAEIGLASAQVNLGLMYIRGQGVARDYEEAAYWLDAAARQGHVLAQYNLGLLYLRGLGVPQSAPRALGWLYLAGKSGHAGALEKLSQLVRQLPGPSSRPDDEADEETGRPTPAPDAAAAAAEAFDQGDDTVAGPAAGDGGAVAAALEAGRAAFLSGDYQGAHAVWRAPAEAGNSEAQYLMGSLYAERRFSGYDLAESYRWHYLAALGGNGAAEAALQQLEAEIPAADRLRGLQLVRAQQAGGRADGGKAFNHR